ncbi:hypothetical protein ANANG_G00050730 [Anguilla anguilla]|uniref:Uncharacterized protein n=1 Tax=Anguilla anguilla TaxID=7936 RepID=A0A9D3MYE1_ANGAN|nr:hypothetical protein ANANG_G00050730 [Anguilla anguilla]
MGLRRFWNNYKYPNHLRGNSRCEGCQWAAVMKNSGWLRKNWLWVAGSAFISIHIGTWLMQKALKSSVRSETQMKQRSVED